MSEHEFDFGTLIPKNEMSPNEVTKSPKKVTTPKTQKNTTRSNPLHILTEKNLIRFIQEQERTKPYEMKIRFYKSSSSEIQKILNSLFKKGLLTRNKNGWISLIKKR